MSDENIDVKVVVENHETDDQQDRVIEAYEENIETFIKKNEDYGGSFQKSAKIESVMRYGKIEEDNMADIVKKQIFIRGMLDKMTRFYKLSFMSGEKYVEGEGVDDTLLDLANYCIMLVSLLRYYSGEE